ncbi:hypothetical protein FACS1894187_17700 [Synergistales bacterium]|nr:hypothetical protein FACS1894187_17700 [Synergistales bacterium]
MASHINVTNGKDRPKGGFKSRFEGEKNLFLRRHADNLVEWYPWGEEAFSRARELNIPIFLSIGYSSSHRCHAMERDCFSDAEIASLMNGACVPVLVDCEERPDLASLFTEVCQIQNGGSGWPLSLFLTPDGEPFFAATWLPKRSVGKMPGLADITPRVRWLWLTQRDEVLLGAKSLVDGMKAKNDVKQGGHTGSFLTRISLSELKSLFDNTWGGFGNPPKSICAPRLLFLLESAKNDGADIAAADKKEAFSMVDLTLRKMWAGGIHDHLGGGYAHCATDARWVTPHFEKLLCDQALLLWVASLASEAEAAVSTADGEGRENLRIAAGLPAKAVYKEDNFYNTFAADIVACVTRDFTSPESCFWTAIDADLDGIEGKYYLWTDDEVHAALPQGDAGIFCAAYAVMPGGNFKPEMSSSQNGSNILYEAIPCAEAALRYGLRAPDVAKRLENDKHALFDARSRRQAPLLDEKVLMDMNGLMIGALARAGRVFKRKDWILAAERAALFLQKVLVDPKGNWRRCYIGKESAIAALPEDYAALMWGVMEIYDAVSVEISEDEDNKTGSAKNSSKNAASKSNSKADSSSDDKIMDVRQRAEERRKAEEEKRAEERRKLDAQRVDKQRKEWLRYAETLADKIEENFWDEEKGGFFLSASDDELIFLRRKSAEDSSVPSANALAMMVYTSLALAMPEENGEKNHYIEKAEAIAAAFSRATNVAPLDNISIITASIKLKNAKAALKEAAKAAAKQAADNKVNEINEPSEDENLQEVLPRHRGRDLRERGRTSASGRNR